jgi:8-hydroxy-5-deazaflavin:NADPH oxidoreductase
VTIAIVGGTGAEGAGLALRFARAGARVRIGSRDLARAQAAAARIGEAAHSTELEGFLNQDAVRGAGAIVVTVPAESQADILLAIGPHLAPGAVVVDATVRLKSDSPEASAQQAARNLPEGTRVAAAFHTLGADLLMQLDHGIDSDVLVCADDPEAKRVATELVGMLGGARAVDAGPLRNGRLIENLVSLLIAINRRNKVKHSGVRITGL